MMKFKLDPPQENSVLPADYETFAEAFDHFLRTWYEAPNSPLDQLEIRHAFYAGAIYLKSLVGRASTSPEGPARTKSLFKELTDEAARNAAAPWTEVLIRARQEEAVARAKATRPDRVQEEPPFYAQVKSTPAEAAPTTPSSRPAAPATAPMHWTLSMVREFAAAHQGARETGAETFAFHGRHFRTSDAPQLIAHLNRIFSAESQKPPGA